MTNQNNLTRKNTKKYFKTLVVAKLFSAVVFLLTFAFLFIYCVFLERETESQHDTQVQMPEFSFTALMNGTFTEQYADYFSDTVHERDWFVQMYGKFKLMFGDEKAGGNEVVWGITDEKPNQKPEQKPDHSTSDPDLSTDPCVSFDPSESSAEVSENQTAWGQEVELDGGLVLSNGRVMEIYGADKKLAYVPRFANVLNQFADSVPGVNVYSMVIPKSAGIYIKYSKDYAHTADNTLHDLNAIEERLSDKVKSINVYDILVAHEKEHIYFNTDHHWTSLGAYYASKKFASDLGLPFADISSYTVENRQGFLGSMYNYSNQSGLVAELAEEFSIYRPNLTYSSEPTEAKNTYYASYYSNDSFQKPVAHDIFFEISLKKNSLWYLTFINGDAYSWKIHSNACNNGRKLLIVKDSYGNALVPYMLYSFEEVYVVDARKFNINLKTFVEQQGITDVLFAECAFSARGGSYISALEALTK